MTGVQTDADATIAAMQQEIDALRECGIDSINVDLIAGLPGQTAESWKASLDWVERLGVPHVYDMHSSLPQQLSNFKYSGSSVLRRVMGWAETEMVPSTPAGVTAMSSPSLTTRTSGDGRPSNRTVTGRYTRSSVFHLNVLKRFWTVPPYESFPLLAWKPTSSPIRPRSRRLRSRSRTG